MRVLTAALMALMTLAPAQAEPVRDPPAAAAEAERRAVLETLYAALAASGGSAEAQAVADRIWQVWFMAPDAEAQALLDRALERRRYGDFDASIAVLDRLIAGWPAYAEGWNQRATLFYLQERYEASLADVVEVLAREPRHFGALAGRAIILLRQGRRDAGQRALLAALRVHPWLAERRLLDPAYGEEPL